jgi:DNA polymerase I-like protein with 3'-5' exonuclease and polymerase domains
MPREATKPKRSARAVSRVQPDPFRRAIAAWHAEGGSITRDGRTVRLLRGPSELAIAPTEHALHRHQATLERLCIPSVTPEQTAQVRAVLGAAGASVAYITDPIQAALAVTELAMEYRAEVAQHGHTVIGLDMETEVLAELRSPIPVKFTKQGQLAIHQPKDGIAGLALDPHSSKVRLVQLWITGTARVFDMHTVPWFVFDPLFRDPTINWAAFNAVFEAKRLIHETGCMPAGRLYDVMTAIWLTHGQRPNLEDAASLVFDLTVPKVLGASDWSADPLSQEQLEYAALDSVLAAALWHEQRVAFEADSEAETAQQVADDAIEAVAHAELHGVGFDRTAHAALVASWEAELATAQAARATAVPGLNWSKRQPVQEHLTAALSGSEEDALDHWPRTPSGLLCTKREVLVRAQHIAGIAQHLEVMRLEKLLNTFGTDLAGKVNPATGRLHTSLVVAGARTGRFSARAPNLQQMPKRRAAEFRKVFIAVPGKLLLAADYSQIELRALAEIVFAAVGESRLREGFAAGLDAHRTTAMHLAGKSEQDPVTKAERDGAKPVNFGLPFGMGHRGFFYYVRDQYRSDITEEEAADLRASFFEAYPEILEWQHRQEQLCRQYGYVETPLGRRWYWKWRARDDEEIDYDAGFIEDQRTGFQRNFAFNMPVQGGDAEVMLLAMARLDRALRRYPAHLCLTVHDEVLIELAGDPSTVMTVRDIVVAEMTAAFLEVFPDAPTLNLIEPTIGRSWGEQVPVDDWLNGHAEAAD